MAIPYPGTALRVGSTGANVRIVQEHINTISGRLGIGQLTTDGIFGPRTQAAVIAFQQQFGLTADGVVGPITWAKLMEVTTQVNLPDYPGTALRRGSSGAYVRYLQECLNSMNNASIGQLVTDGVFGPRTEAAVIAFQRYVGINPDGVVGPITWGRLREFCGGSGGGIAPPCPCPPPVEPPVVLPPVPPPITPRRRVVLDAGHGGADSGAVAHGRREKDDNLRLTRAVRQILVAQGVEVIMTRDADITLSLAERSAIANRNNPDLFVSIHRNASTNTNANGVENFVFTTASNATLLRAFDVLDELATAGVQNNRGVLRANFSVLRNTNAPGMLLEVGFITNAEDNRLFDRNFDAYAAAIARGIIEALNSPNNPSGFSFYTVVAGDSLPAIAARFGTTVNALTSLNYLTTNVIQIGQVLKIPA